jgi:multidrug efflux pump subunit AcrA (membrane-fusion protein)
VRVGAPDEQESLLVPDAALGSDQGGRYLLVLDRNNTVEQRQVTIGPRVGDLRVIESGLKPDDRIVVAGILRAIPGQKTTQAARARFRPIVMTSLAFILGVVPLVLASGAGASARTSIGITVFTGMIASTCLAVFVPPFFAVARHFEEWPKARKSPSPARTPAEQ